MKKFLSSKNVIKILISIIIFLIIIAIIILGIIMLNKYNKENEDLSQVQDMYEEISDDQKNEIENTVLTVAIEDKKKDEFQKVEEKEKIPTTYNGFETIGKIEISKTNLNTYILKQVTVAGMEVAPCFLYTTGELNKSGNTLIVGHNYKNDTIFSNNKYLEIGDIIKITGLDGNTVEYKIYNKFITKSEDVNYLKESTLNKVQIALSCCTDEDDNNRIVILASAEN